MAAAHDPAATASPEAAFVRFIELFDRHGVEFVVVGGQAEVLMGGARVTFDTDLCYRRTADNLRRLAAALADLKPTLRGPPPDLDVPLDERALALGNNYTFLTPLGSLDLLGHVEPIGGYDELLKSAETLRVGDVTVRTISLGDLIEVKMHIKRGKDAESLAQLFAIRRRREAESDR